MSWLYYLLESNLYLIAFYGLYQLLFRRETYYQLNRAYLLLSTVLAFIIPLLQIGAIKQVSHIQNAGFTVIEFPAAVITPAQVAEPSWLAENYYLLAYSIVTFLLLGVFVFKIYKLIRLSRGQKGETHHDFKLIELPGEKDAFSFFNYLFIGEELTISPTIIRHEMIHIRQRHSLDIVYLELFKIINWFNPIAYLLQSSMKEVHEFIADSETVDNGQNISAYADFLLNNAYGIHSNTLTNTFFNKNLLKKRIMMLHQKRSGSAARLKFLVVMPLLAGLLCVSTLAFAKTYGWIDLVPEHPLSTEVSLPASESKLLKIAQRNTILITDKLSIYEKNGKVLSYTPKSLTKNDKAYLLSRHKMQVDVIEADHIGAYKLVKGLKIYYIHDGKDTTGKISREVVIKQTDSAVKSKIGSVNKRIDSTIKGGIKEAESRQQSSNKLPPPAGYFAGCRTLYTYLGKHLHYPARYFEQKTVDNVIVEFTTGADYKISGVKIKNNAMPLFANEVTRGLKAYADTVNRPPGTYFFLIQFNLINEKHTRTWLPSEEYLHLTGNPDCAGNIEIVGFVKDE